jgi:ectoine hydroxylase-related dioxygenase (phytanoyl-CoA dioxygenase family)
MSTHLSAEKVSQYHERGYLSPLPVFSEDEVVDMNLKLAGFREHIGGKLAGRFNQKTHLLATWLNRMVRDPRILDPVEDILGPNLLCWSSQFFAKDAHDKSYVGWHQDGNYWGLSSDEVITAWVAFTPSTVRSGCMMVVPGTHRQVVEHVDTFSSDNMLSRGQEITVTVKRENMMPVELQPGQMSLHHVLIHHGSDPNQSDLPRIGFAIRYIPTHVSQINGMRGSALLVRGQDQYHHFDAERDPAVDFDAQALQHHQEVLDSQLKILYAGAKQQGKLAIPKS